MFKNNKKNNKVILTEKDVIELIRKNPKRKLDYLVSRGYIDKYKPYYGFHTTIFLINGELLMIENFKFEILKLHINFDVLIDEEGGDFYDA